MIERVETPERLLECIQREIPHQLDFSEVSLKWPVRQQGVNVALIAEDERMRIWLDQAVMSDRLGNGTPTGSECVGTIYELINGHWTPRAWTIEWDAV